MIERAKDVLAHLHIATLPQYLAWCRRQWKARNLTQVDVRTPILAKVDFGRWIIRCECDGGIVTDPDWAFAPCAGCGRVYHAVIYPAERNRIEAVLLERPKQGQRFWNPGETVDKLLAENVRHGIREARG